jgi:hypothetical protein
MDNFANHPKSISEIKAQKEGDGAMWSPRDALIEMLREIDSGNLDVKSMIIAYETAPDEGRSYTCFSSACPSPLIALGLLVRAAHRVNVCMSVGDG